MLDSASLTLVGRVLLGLHCRKKSGGWRRNFVRRQ